jgi:hypothetical protein
MSKLIIRILVAAAVGALVGALLDRRRACRHDDAGDPHEVRTRTIGPSGDVESEDADGSWADDGGLPTAPTAVVG